MKDTGDIVDFGMKDLIKTALVLFLAMTLLTGLAYPLLVTGIARAVFPAQASGSFITADGRLAPVGATSAGSRSIGQPFASPGYFWSRPSATTPGPYNAASSSGSNLGPIDSDLSQSVAKRVGLLRDADSTAPPLAPVDLVTASASGLDPDISPASALYQVRRVALARGVDEAEIAALVQSHIKGRTFGILGEPRVNVLELNLDLDRLYKSPSPRKELR